jgi:hypothetical protein
MINGMICSQCCGEYRNTDECSGCTFYSDPQRNYNSVPAYSIQEMFDSFDLADYANIIEGALVTYDLENDHHLTDDQAVQIIKLLIDKYYFNDETPNCDEPLILNGFEKILAAIEEDMPSIEHGILVKILGVIHFVAMRRIRNHDRLGNRKGREYINIITQNVGCRLPDGDRLMILPKD